MNDLSEWYAILIITVLGFAIISIGVFIWRQPQITNLKTFKVKASFI
jgi:hypothetical protein